MAIIESYNVFNLNDDEIKTLKEFGISEADLRKLYDELVAQFGYEAVNDYIKLGLIRNIISDGIGMFLHGEELYTFLKKEIMDGIRYSAG